MSLIITVILLVLNFTLPGINAATWFPQAYCLHIYLFLSFYFQLFVPLYLKCISYIVRVIKLWLQAAASFCKWSFMGARPCPFLYLVSVVSHYTARVEKLEQKPYGLQASNICSLDLLGGNINPCYKAFTCLA